MYRAHGEAKGICLHIHESKWRAGRCGAKITSRRPVAVCIVGAVLMTPGLAAAQTCGAYVGKTVAPVTFQRAISSLPSIALKGEYETTSQYEARTKAVGEVGPLIISKKLESPNFLEYDADKEKLSIFSGAFAGYGFDAQRATVYSPEFRAFKPDGGMTYHVNISPKNAAKLDVIFEHVAGRADYNKFELFSTVDGTSLLGSLSLNPTEAQRIRPFLKLAFIVVPKAPFIVRATYLGDPKTYGRATEINATLLIADIRCGLVLDDAGKVLAAYPTR